jgi:MSHA pilin protein MshD
MTTRVARIYREAGATLVELVVSIVIISLATTGVFLAINRNASTSADPVILHQAVAIAEAYMEEILGKDFCDPDNATPCTPPNAPGTAACQICPASEALRNQYDNVCDYNALPDTVVRDQGGAAIPALAAYNVQTTVSFTDILGPALNQLTGAQCQLLRVDVAVTGPGGVNYALSGFRTIY